VGAAAHRIADGVGIVGPAEDGDQRSAGRQEVQLVVDEVGRHVTAGGAGHLVDGRAEYRRGNSQVDERRLVRLRAQLAHQPLDVARAVVAGREGLARHGAADAVGVAGAEHAVRDGGARRRPADRRR
jgi:hypothetical protein